MDLSWGRQYGDYGLGETEGLHEFPHLSSPCGTTGACMLVSHPFPCCALSAVDPRHACTLECMSKCADWTWFSWDIHRVTHLPPGISHLHLWHCHVGDVQLPPSCRLRSLQLRKCAGGTIAQKSNCTPLRLLQWLEACQVLEDVQVGL